MPIDLQRPKRDASERVKVAGIGLHMKPAYATHANGVVTFAALLKAGPRAGQAVRVTAPILSVETSARWIARRLRGFAANPGSRESFEDAIRRKVIAAQGEAHVRALKKTLDAHERMELAMMLSPDSHASAMDPEEATKAIALTVGADGSVRGLDDVDTVQHSDGALYSRAEEE